MAYLRIIPGMTVMVPEDEAELQNMLYTALDAEGPVAIRYPRASGRGIPMPDSFEKMDIGKARVIDHGESALLLGIGTGVGICCRAGRLMAERYGLRPTVANARFLKPLDEAMILELAERHEIVVTVEEGTLLGGFGTAVKELLVESGKPVKSFGFPDEFIPHGNRNKLLKDIGLTPEAIAAFVGEKLLEQRMIKPEKLMVSGEE